MTRERANEIFEQAKARATVGPWSDQLDHVMSAEERADIMARWRTMPGHCSFVSALFAIKNGED